MSSSPYKLTHKQFMSQPVEELKQLFPEVNRARDERSPRWSWMQYEQHQGVTLHHPELIGALLEESHLEITVDPWSDPLNLGGRALLMLPHTQRKRPKTMALEAIAKHTPDLFYHRWLPWIEGALKEAYREAREVHDAHAEPASAEGDRFPDHLYQTLRAVSLKVIARTLCTQFKGELLTSLERALEGIDTAYARVAFGDKRARFGVFTSPDVKLATQSIRDLEMLIRPIVRAHIGGTSEGDDLITRWVNTRSLDGRSLKEDQVIEEVICFLTMAYSSLPKILFGAVCELSADEQSELRKELRSELNNAVKLITAPPVMDENTPPPITPQNESALRSLPLHHTTVLEAQRLYPPTWLSPLGLKRGIFLLGDEYDSSKEGPKVSAPSVVWLSPWALQRERDLFHKPQRFSPQRWSGNLESDLPKYAFSPFGALGAPALSEVYCTELAARFLMLWGARYCVLDAPKTLQWELSLCLRPLTPIRWAQRRDLKR